MRMRWQAVIGLALLLTTGSLSPPAQAGDFFSNLFGGFFRPPMPRAPIMLPFGQEGQPMEAPRPRVAFSSGPAWCVRGCDGRYFPITGPDAQSNCNSFCPASKTDVVFGSDIDHAVTSTGEPYSGLPNAFKYRTEMVAGCTCNGKNQAGLAPVSIENDPTLHRGDIVAASDGLMIAHPGSGRHADPNFTPLPRSIRARFKRVPVVAKE
ncbi:MAG TPA: DUF2865 domain-containing protein [Bradyrhizobium sp.]|uniref:DUF2865 domain-containing protein n=1 Tax=Bradyrhizobium sp. TaxID=376 RepID=UPI002C853C3D|nr:DUF2865 domain-containing protein [Bradyrhizobium sp.]HLZ04246.1 DUF2865 domain-containing protein [Bradyrhizobium sp.]